MLVTIIPLSLAGLLRLARFCVLHHNSARIGLLPSTNVVSLSLVSAPPFGMHIVWHSSALLSTCGGQTFNWRYTD